jgi:hypothetical protein
MSRWIDNFKNHAFQNEWRRIKAQTENLTANDETVVTAVEEIARLKKVIAFLDVLLEAVDAEIVPQNVWNQFYEQINPCLNQVNIYIENKNIEHINNANIHLDNLLSYLKPYVVNSKSSAVAAGRAYNTYSKTINDHLRLIEGKVQSIITQSEHNKAQADILVAEIEASKNNIKKMENSFFVGDDGSLSLQKKMENLFSESNNWHSKIKDFHQKLTSGNEQESAIILQIDEAKKRVLADKKAAEDANDSVAELLDELKEFYTTIFGKDGQDGQHEGGLKKELELRRQELSDLKETHQKTYKTLEEEIESLLPGAVSAGLATAYKDLKDSFNTPINQNSKIFYLSLFGIFIAGVIMIVKNMEFWKLEFIDLNEPMHLFTNLIYKLPILLPLLWLAVFASKRRSEDRRLQQEYAHKEALAKSYQSFKMQIDSLNTQDDKLMKHLLEKAIIAIAFNPSTTLDGKHGDRIPIVGAVEAIAEKLTEKGILEFNPLKDK